MSTLAYSVLAPGKQEGIKGLGDGDGQSPMKTFIAAMSALIPGEVLLAHAAILEFTTETSQNAAGQAVTTITEGSTLELVFYALIPISIIVYVLGRIAANKLEKLDAVRAFLPPVAFVIWTMLQRSTAFDAVAPDMETATRFAVAILLALLVGAVAAALQYKTSNS